ncbi:hypothetical protein PoB_003565200 [Plakobranchus ocellatus]|uniref:Uncharacterized protein n=1 Tax=Plakobranchus ocellatus TaxID=259542 RepID=A0AAV4AQD4_9GAST|nr:hypothetical protein PoB_003565200 [Plakobranchus ocellatus]
MIQFLSSTGTSSKRSELGKLRHAGNHCITLQVLKSGQGDLVVERLLKKEDAKQDEFVPGPKCLGYFSLRCRCERPGSPHDDRCSACGERGRERERSPMARSLMGIAVGTTWEAPTRGLVQGWGENNAGLQEAPTIEVSSVWSERITSPHKPKTSPREVL